MKRNFTLAILFWSFTIVFQAIPAYAQQAAKSSSEKVRLTVPAKSLTFAPYYFGRAQGIFAKEGVDLEIIVMRPPLGVTALVAGDLDYSAAGGLSIRAAMKGVPLRTITFIQTRLSFSLIGQPGMIPARIRNVAVSGIGSLAHYGAQTVLKRLGRDGPGDKINYIATNTTGNSYAALTGKAADAVILTAPYTSMATLAGYVDLGDTFDVRDVQGGLVGRVSDIQNHREQIKAVLRAVLRSNETILKNDAEVIPFIQKEFGLEQNVAADSYRQIKQVLNADGDIEEPVLKSILNKIRQESGIAAEIPVDRLVDLSILREARAELRKR
ncbi:MAG TPA: ABC transporter substrate-binding protein [Candidatus Polarisedimenticolaceae bacterium]|nr:ABC transporter substrate-binding protein [Candidatus Polarisedimenticolaceae bacterium]